VDLDRVKWATTELLLAIGEDPQREGLRDTPRRVANFWREFVEYDPGNCDTSFDVEENDQMVVVSGMHVWSLCEHHLMPFHCDVAIGYIAHERVLGLSKFGRIVQECAHRLQIQERLVLDIANEVGAITGSPDIAVIARGEHLCMTMRGVKMASKLTSSVMRGTFLESPSARAEFLSLSKP
jgi:GTP cyclohydrolase IA